MIFIEANINYIDPGTGSYLYQILIAAGIAVGVYFRSTKAYILSIISKIRKKDVN
tara:strand:- start:147 stop:311 length:165 start_codon:yes stop_codon:yes gene_type:complete